jgi:hypothetical protein
MSKSKVNQRRTLKNPVNLKPFAADQDLLRVAGADALILHSWASVPAEVVEDRAAKFTSRTLFRSVQPSSQLCPRSFQRCLRPVS